MNKNKELKNVNAIFLHILQLLSNSYLSVSLTYCIVSNHIGILVTNFKYESTKNCFTIKWMRVLSSITKKVILTGFVSLILFAYLLKVITDIHF